MKKIHEVKVAMAGEIETCSVNDLVGAFTVLAAGSPTQAAECLIELIFSLINQLFGTQFDS